MGMNVRCGPAAKMQQLVTHHKNPQVVQPLKDWLLRYVYVTLCGDYAACYRAILFKS